MLVEMVLADRKKGELGKSMVQTDIIDMPFGYQKSNVLFIRARHTWDYLIGAA